MQLKAKFHCSEVHDYGYAKRAELNAVVGTEGENADFSKATPSGTFSIYIDQSTPAINFFQPQKDYYLTIEEVN